MKITAIEIENFKIYETKTRIPFRDFNLFAGANSAGKSTVYQVLFCLAQSAGFGRSRTDSVPTLVLNGRFVQLGLPSDVLSNLDKGSLMIGIEWDGNKGAEFRFRRNLSGEGQKNEGPQLELDSFALWMNDSESGIQKVIASQEDDYWNVRATRALDFTEGLMYTCVEAATVGDDSTAVASGEQGSRVLADEVEFTAPARSLVFYGLILHSMSIQFSQISNTVHADYQQILDVNKIRDEAERRRLNTEEFRLRNVLSVPMTGLLYSLDSLEFILPFRGFPLAFYSRDQGLPEWLRDYLDRENTLVAGKFDFEERTIKKDIGRTAVQYWVADFFHLCDSITVTPVAAGAAFSVSIHQNGKELPLRSAGFGTSQLIPIIVRIVLGESGAVYVIDEPETHLHPKLQSRLAEFFVQMAMTGRQIVLETHSEYFIRKLIALMLERPEAGNAMRLNWVDGGTVRDIDFDELGYVVAPPADFMSEHDRMVDELSVLRLRKLNDIDD